MSYRQVQAVAVRLMRGEVIEVTDHRRCRWRASRDVLTGVDEYGRQLCAAVGSYDVAVTLCWWVATERITGILASDRAA